MMKKKMLFMLSVLVMASCTKQSLLNGFDEETIESVRIEDVSNSSLIDAYTEKARWGDVTGYMNLAKCYHDGVGVKADLISFYTMLDLVMRQGHADMAHAYLDSLPADDSMKMMLDVFSHIDFDDQASIDSIAKALSGSNLMDGQLFHGLSQMNMGDTIGAFYTFQEVAEKGSFLAELLLSVTPRPGEAKNKTVKLERLAALCDRYPVVSKLVADLYVEEYPSDAEYTNKAARYYQMADKHGFLDKGQARWLLEYYTQEGIPIDDKERERLETLARYGHDRFMPEIDFVEEPIDSVCVDTISVMEQ